MSLVLIIAIAMPLATTLSEASHVPVTKDLWAMELTAQVCFELLKYTYSVARDPGMVIQALVKILLNNVLSADKTFENSSSDINECVVGTDNCHSYATCNNTIGSFTCTCDQGFMGNGVNCTGVFLSVLRS